MFTLYYATEGSLPHILPFTNQNWFLSARQDVSAGSASGRLVLTIFLLSINMTNGSDLVLRFILALSHFPGASCGSVYGILTETLNLSCRIILTPFHSLVISILLTVLYKQHWHGHIRYAFGNSEWSWHRELWDRQCAHLIASMAWPCIARNSAAPLDAYKEECHAGDYVVSASAPLHTWFREFVGHWRQWRLVWY